MALVNLRDLSEMRKKGFVTSFSRGLSLRLHVSLIIAFSWCCGLLVTWQMHNAGVDSLVVRYGAALIVGYTAFLAGVRLWLWCVLGAEPGRNNLVNDVPNSVGDLPSFNVSGGTGGGISAPQGGGGASGGGGAGGSWSESSSLSGGGGGGIDVDVDVGDGDSAAAIVILICLIALAITFIATIIYVVYIGPHLLSEAAFQFLLAGGLLKHARKTTSNWMECVIKDTWIPFTIVFAFTMVFAGAATYYFPQAHTMGEVLRAAGLLD